MRRSSCYAAVSNKQSECQRLPAKGPIFSSVMHSAVLFAESTMWCSGYDEYDYAVIIHRGRLSSGRRPAICRMFPLFAHHTMQTYLRQVHATTAVCLKSVRNERHKAPILCLLHVTSDLRACRATSCFAALHQASMPLCSGSLI